MQQRQPFRQQTVLHIILVACAMLLLPGCDSKSPEANVAADPVAEPAVSDSTAPAAAQPTASPGDSVSFFVLGKTWHFQQEAAGLIGPNDIHYFAEIFSKAGGGMSEGSMRLLAPGAEPIPFDHETDNGAVLHAREGKIHLQLADLDGELPNGDYAFSFHTPTGNVQDFVMSLGSAGTVTDLPPPPAIQLVQGGAAVSPEAVRAGEDLQVSWTPFTSGRADPNGIADDLIFVMMEDCQGNRVYHSGRPLLTPNPLVDPDQPSATWLTYTATEITVAGAQLIPGMSYRLEVELAKLMDTDRRDGVVGMTTFAATTHLDVKTAGEVTPGTCPEPGEVLPGG